jgi:hypothetical protein
VPKFTNSWTYNPFHDLPDYTGFLAQLDIKEKNDGGLLYSYSFPLFGTSPQSIWYWY